MPFTPEQLLERRGFLGASECSAALGCSPFFSQVELYQAKIGQGEPIEETLPMMVGTALEPVAIRLFEKDTQYTVSDRQRQFVDPTTPWRRCTVDAMAPDGWIVEAKTSGDFRGWGMGHDEIPEHYLFNAHHSLACVPDAPGVYFPVLVGGRTFKNYVVRREPELVELVKQGEAQFMELVRKRRPPEPKSREDVMLLHPKSTDMFVLADALIEGLVKEVAVVKGNIKDAEKTKDSLIARITAFMGSAGTLKRMSLGGSQGSVIATWNSQERRTIDADALRANYPDVAKTVTKVSTTRMFLNK